MTDKPKVLYAEYLDYDQGERKPQKPGMTVLSWAPFGLIVTLVAAFCVAMVVV